MKIVLEERYGSSFAITEAFCDKQYTWPSIQARDLRNKSPKIESLLIHITIHDELYIKCNKPLLNLCKAQWAERRDAYNHFRQAFQHIIACLVVQTNVAHVWEELKELPTDLSSEVAERLNKWRTGAENTGRLLHTQRSALVQPVAFCTLRDPHWCNRSPSAHSEIRTGATGRLPHTQRSALVQPVAFRTLRDPHWCNRSPSAHSEICTGATGRLLHTQRSALVQPVAFCTLRDPHWCDIGATEIVYQWTMVSSILTENV